MKKVSFQLSKNIQQYLSKEIDWMKLSYPDPVIQIIWGKWGDEKDFDWSIGFNYKSNMDKVYVENCIYVSEKFDFFIIEEEWSNRLSGKIMDIVNGRPVFLER